MRIGICADSTCDLPKDIIDKNQIRIVPLNIVLGDVEKKDGLEVSVEELFAYVAKTGNLPKTSAINIEEFKSVFAEMKKEYDAIIYFSISFKISSSGINAKKASEEFENIFVIDSKSLSTGNGLLILSAIDKIKEGKDLQTILTEVNDEVEKVQASFCVDTLKYLHKGGRCSSIALLGANLLHIKPRISLVNGVMEMTKKYRGKIEDVLVKYANEMLKEVSPNKKRVFITHSSPMDETTKVLRKMLSDYGFEEIIESSAGCTVSTHCGKKTLGILYIAK